MKRRSSGTTEDSEDSPVEVPLLNGSAPSGHDRQPSADRRTSLDTRPQSARSRRQQNINWQQSDLKNASHGSKSSITSSRHRSPLAPGTEKDDSLEMDDKSVRRSRFRSPWAISLLVFITSIVGIAFLVGILHSAATRQLDPKGFRMSYMRPQYIKFGDFDTEHTRFASKYSLYLYREQPIEQGAKVRGTPILFIPGNAGSYKQVRPIASETAHYFHDAVRKNPDILKQGIRNFDFFTVDFNEDFTAFHGQTMEDQAEYVNEAIRYILSLYLDPRVSDRDPSLPDPTSVIVLGHSMGGIVARTMLVMPNYQAHSINTIITMSAPHARPPVTFDRQIVQIYDKINTYWREAYSQQWANNNPLWHVTLVSIAGGSLDTVVPSDYASVESLVPATHGFTVFTTTIPDVWTSMDHQSILWCEQFKKVVARTLFDIMDVSRGSQTKPRADRMRAFKKYLLTGMESIAEKNLPARDGEHALALEDHSNKILAQGDRLVLRKLGTNNKLQRYFLPIPPQGPPEGKRFTLLTDAKLDGITGSSPLDVRVCSISPLHPGQAGAVLPIKPELAGDNTGPGRLECRDMTPDAITLPASTADTRYPFFLAGEKEVPPFSYLQYDLEALADYQFVVVTDRANKTTSGFVVGEFNDLSQSLKAHHISIQRLLAFGMSFRLPADRQMVTEIKIPSVQSSLLAYRLKLSNHGCGSVKELFMPLVRQYLEEPYESKYFVNAREVAISLHGVSPYVPPPLKAQTTDDGLSLQFWTDPTCESSINIHLEVDWYGSLGKLNMRYRTVFGAFPLLLVALVLQKQFKIYDATGVFITFSEALDNSLRHSVPLILLSLTLMALSTGSSEHANLGGQGDWKNVTLGTVDFSRNDFLVGTGDPFFWFMTPLVGVVCIGVCVGMNYLVLAVTQFFGMLYSFTFVRPIWSLSEERRKALAPTFTVSPPKRRLLVTAFLLFLISFTFPYQFAYAIACLVQLVTTARAHRVATDTRTPASYNFYNYAHSILLMMIWILPINLPILVVWVRNLAVHWLTPFSSHHNILLVTPFVLLVEAHASGKMVPRVTSQLRHLTGVLLVGIAIYAGIYGVSRAYMLHYLVNIVAVWLVALHMTTDSWAYAGVSSIFDGSVEDGRKQGKDP